MEFLSRKKIEEIIFLVVEEQFTGFVPTPLIDGKPTREMRYKEDLEADELDMVELLMEFEDEFEVNIPDAEADRWATIGDTIDYICSLRTASAS